MTSQSALWYATRGAGMVSLILLTAVVVLGILARTGWATRRWPRFVSQTLHRDLSLASVVFVALHIVTAVLDPFAHLGLVDSVIPFASQYRPVWLGLGVVAFELMLALVATSLMRHVLGLANWRLIHWLAYLCWPIALVHGLGTGSDTTSLWAMAISVACLLAVAVAVLVRLNAAQPATTALRLMGATATLVIAGAICAWTYAGPLQVGWALASGTPASLRAPSSTSTTGTSPAATLAVGLVIDVSGTAETTSDGSILVSLQTTTSPALTLSLTDPADPNQSLSLVIDENGSQLCNISLTNDGRELTGSCGTTEVVLRLEQLGDGTIDGQMTTQSGTASGT